MAKQTMPWNRIQVPNTIDANALEQTFEETVMEMLQRPIRDAIRKSFAKTMGSVGRGPMDDSIKPPKEGTICHAIWSELDKMQATGTTPKLENILTAAQANEWNPATTRTQYATWRRYHGIPAQQKQMTKAPAPAAQPARQAA
jgi:hypothetical protein